MCPKIVARIQFVAFLLIAILPWSAAIAQKAPTASLAEQLRAQYKVVKLAQQDNPAKVLQPGTALIIQKGGIPTVPYANATVCSAKYQDGKLDSPDALCPESARKSSRPFKVGEKVYATQIDVDLKAEKISFRILGCDSCTGTTPATPSKSEVVFQFAPGYLEKASVLEVEDTIGNILAIDNSSASQALQAATSPPEEADPNLLTNAKIAKMASVKLGDAVILNAIKTSPSSFDTSPDALIKLKQAGVSDAVLQAMQEAAAPPQTEASNAPTTAPSTGEAPASAPTRSTFPVQHRHIQLLGSDNTYCSGDLSLSSDGTVRYDCTQTDDPSGRCDHVSIPSGSLLQAKVGSNGALHLVSKGKGNFDFFGDAGTIKEALAAIAPLTGVPSAASPPTAAANCGDFDSCMKKAAASLEQPQGAAEALAEFQKASELEPSKSEPLVGKGFAYLQMAQYGYVSAMWDKALQSGATLSISSCRVGISCGDTGNFLLSTKEVSFVNNKKGEKEFAAAPSAITSVESAPHAFGSAYYWQFQAEGKKYRFYLLPRGIHCRSSAICPEPGLTQQQVVADYLHATLDKLKTGTFNSQPSKP